MSKSIRRIGASQLATVSEFQTPQGETIALKEFNRLPLSPLQRERIFGAAERWKQLTVPELVHYLDVSAGQDQISMELLDRSAAIRLREGPSDPRLVLHTIRGLLMALAQLHELGLLHVNVKPTNVFFDSDGRVRLSDGLLIDARLPVALPPPLNLKYLAPELASSNYGPVSPATDLYCVGFLALELLGGDRFPRAFQGIRGDAGDEDMAWSQWHGSSQTAPSANLFAKGCPDELASVIARLVAKQPSLRYSTARQALHDLPQDITGQKPATPTPRPTTEKKREALATHVITRPATGIVLAIASGSRTGEMIGSNENELMLGFDHDCFVRFSHDQYPHGGGKVLMRRGPQGWYALRVAGDSAFVNQHALEEKCPLRSGDIVRLSSRGPDVQFTMQSGGVAIRSLVERFLPTQSQRPLSPGVLAAATAAAASAVGPRGTVVSAPQQVGATKPVASDRTPATVAGPRVSQQLASKKISVVGPPVEKVPVEKVPVEKVPGEKVPVHKLVVHKLAWLHPRSWNTALRNFFLALLGAIVIIVLASLLMRPATAPTVPPQPDNATGAVDVVEASSATDPMLGSESDTDLTPAHDNTPTPSEK